MSKKHYKKCLLGLLIVLVISTLVFFVIKNKSNNNVELLTVRIGYRAHSMYAPLFVGLEKNIFIKEGLKVEVVEFQSTNQLMEALIADRIDAALGGVNTFLLFTIEEKSPGYFKVFSLTLENQEHPASFIVTPANSTLSIKDLKNKKIASYLGSGVSALYRRFIEQNQITGTELVQMEPKLELSSLQAGQVDAAIVLEPLATTGTYKNISRPLEQALFDKYFIKDIPFAASVVSTSFIKKYPDVVRRLVLANDLTLDFINKHPDEVKAILSKYTPLDKAVATSMALAPYQKFVEMNKKKVQELSDLLLSIGEIKKPVISSSMFLEYD
ncbi:MAG: ABC transporter substrate-binding protein [Planctomycetes bacterium]|jgi:NitT/TauT family transport system substrate-binding protein|nr:ABC transporter substrate-binding protein [Planctomycetota bacterium]